VPTTTARQPLLPVALAATLLTTLLVVFSASPALAHDTLLESSPGADASVQTLPEELTLTFSADVITGDGATAVVVTDAEGEPVSDGEPEVEGAVVTQPLTSEGDAGVYDVVWKVVSSDGHPISGEFSFTVETSTASEPTTPSPTPTSSPDEQDAGVTPAPTETTASSEGEPGDGDSFTTALPWILIALAVAAGGGALIAVFVAKARRKRQGDDSDASTEG